MRPPAVRFHGGRQTEHRLQTRKAPQEAGCTHLLRGLPVSAATYFAGDVLLVLLFLALLFLVWCFALLVDVEVLAFWPAGGAAAKVTVANAKAMAAIKVFFMVSVSFSRRALLPAYNSILR